MGIFDNLGRNIATVGSLLGQPDRNISEFFSGSKTQNQPYYAFNTGTNYAQNNSGQVAGTTSTNPQGSALFGPQNPGFQYQNPAGPAKPSAGGGGQQQPQPNFGPQQSSLPSNDQSGQINSGWDSYTNSLNDLLNNNLPGQRQSQEQIAQNAHDTGVTQAGQQKEQGIQDVNTQQARSLKDLAGNVRNLFNAGNTFLGSRGASDSSGANQYSYAITQMGTKERGNIMKQAQDRVAQIGDIYNAETNRLQSDLTNNMAAISQWFSEQQAALKQQLGQAGMGRSQDLQAASQNLYNQALGEMQRIQSEVSNRRRSLESWALSNSKTVQEAIANMNSVSNSMPQFQGIQGGMPQVTAEGQQYIPSGYGATEEQKNRGLFG